MVSIMEKQEKLINHKNAALHNRSGRKETVVQRQFHNFILSFLFKFDYKCDFLFSTSSYICPPQTDREYNFDQKTNQNEIDTVSERICIKFQL